MDKIKLSLLDNGVSFIEESLEQAIRAEGHGKQESWKFAIVHLAVAFELLIKEVLFRKDPRSIYEGSSNKTITAKRAVIELIKREDSLFSEEERNDFKALLNIRNYIIHASLDYPLIKMKTLFISQFVLLKNLADHQLKIHIEDKISQELWDEALELQLFLDALEKGAQKKIMLNDILELDVANCTECQGESLVFQVVESTAHCGDGISFYKCFRCGHEYEDLQSCEECGQLLHKEQLELKEAELEGEVEYRAVCSSCMDDSTFYYEIKYSEYLKNVSDDSSEIE